MDTSRVGWFMTCDGNWRTRTSIKIWGSLLLLLGTGPLQAAELYPSVDDLLLCVQARTILNDDELLRPLNLGVRVRHREIELWGAVPSLELSLRAEIKLRTLLDCAESSQSTVCAPGADFAGKFDAAKGHPPVSARFLAHSAAAPE